MRRILPSLKSLCVAIAIIILPCLSSPPPGHASPADARRTLVDLTLKEPYVIYRDSATQMMVLWQLTATDTARIEWGTDTTYALGSMRTGEYGSDHQHACIITGLTPGTKYFYRVTNEGVPHRGSFFSAPAAGASRLKFLAYGDTRTSPTIHDQVAGGMISAYTADPEYQSFALMVGDFVTDGTSEAYWTGEFFSPAYPNIRRLMANLPYEACTGNHEGYGLLFAKYFPYLFIDPNLGTGGRYWSFDYGPAHIVMIDQYDYFGYGPGSPQLQWISNDLAASSKPWKFICLHEPGWSAGRNNASVQAYLQPLCEQYGVSIIFGGHNHYYSRAVVCGVQHITTGGGGAPLGVIDPSYPYVVKSAAAYHFCKIAIDGDDLVLKALTADGTVLDSVALHRRPVGDWTIASTSGSHGRICQRGLVSVVNGASEGFSMVPDPGYHVADVLVDAASVGPVAGYTFNHVTANHTISASFAINAYALDITVVGCGSVTRSPDLPQYDKGVLVTLTAVPAPGFAFVGWDGDLISTQNPMSFPMNSPRHLIATFKPLVTVLAPNGGESIQIGSSLDVRWSAAQGASAIAVDVLFSWSGAGGPYDTLAAGVPNTGSYHLLVPSPETSNAFVGIVAHDSCGGSGSDVSDAAFGLFGVLSAQGTPVPTFALEPVWPNPVRGAARLQFSVPRTAAVRLSVLDLQGREIAVLAEGERTAGRHTVEWNGRGKRGEAPAGLYLVRMVTPGGTFVRRLVIVR